MRFRKNCDIVNRSLVFSIRYCPSESEKLAAIINKHSRMAGLKSPSMNLWGVMGHSDMFKHVSYGLPINFRTIR